MAMPNALIKETKAGKHFGFNSNVAASGNFGIGTHLTNLDACTPVTFTPAQIIVTHTPTLFRYYDHAPKILKDLMEKHTKTFSGIDFGYVVDMQDTLAGLDGQNLKSPLRVTRTQVSPTATLPEINHNFVWNFIKNWIFMIQHPDTHASHLSALGHKLEPMVLSSYCMNICIIQHDLTMRPENIIDGFMITNMMPMETGMFGLEKNVEASQAPERSIPFSGIMQHNANTKFAAMEIARLQQAHRADYDFATPVDTKIADEIKDAGIQKEMDEVMKDFVVTT